MAVTTFDTLKFAQRLEQAGISNEQAVAFAEAQKQAFAEAVETQIATKSDISSLDKRLNGIQAEIVLMKWMIGFNLAFTMAILWKIFS